ncbi:MAG: hypothetical protein LBN23_03245 [Paludibacter sp.]|jgi:hypothetical protein|nr:hypothetical protein [Paludibacter sp.]
MVYINRQAKIDLDNIVSGLLVWKKVELSVPEVMQYVDDIVAICYALDKKHSHSQAQYQVHLKFGRYAYPYKRNQNTIWFIVYNLDDFGNVFVNKIINNYLTVS